MSAHDDAWTARESRVCVVTGVRQQGSPEPGPLLATGDPALSDAVQATALALGVDLEVVRDVEAQRGTWRAAPLRLVGADLVEQCARAESLEATIVVGMSQSVLLEASSRLRLPAMLLPHSSDALAEVLVSHKTARPKGRGLCLLGASGGVGASSLAVALSAAAVAAGVRSAVVELARFGGGIDLLFGAETRPGLRWADLAQASGQIGALDGRLLASDGVSVLALDRRNPIHPSGGAVEAVLTGLRRTHDLVVVDGGRDGVPDGLGRGVRQVLVVAADVASVAAGRMQLARMDLCAPGVVVRSGPSRTLPPPAVAEALGLELLGVVRHDKAVPRLAESGSFVASRAAASFRRDARRLWEVLSDDH